jgi:hypothetical protein
MERVGRLRYVATVLPSKLEINDSSAGSTEKSVGTANGLLVPATAVAVDATGPVVVTVTVAGLVAVALAVFEPVLSASVQGKETVGWVVTGIETG